MAWCWKEKAHKIFQNNNNLCQQFKINCTLKIYVESNKAHKIKFNLKFISTDIQHFHKLFIHECSELYRMESEFYYHGITDI